MDISSATLGRLAAAMPHGRALLPEVWRARHRVVIVLLWIHAAAIALASLALDRDVAHALLEAAPVGAAAVIAARARLRQTVSSAIATVGLFTASATIVHLSGGYIEAHFHFFVMVGLITLYQDWVPFATALVTTVVHHATVGLLWPHLVYNHPAALERPLLWAVIHGAFVLAAAATHLFSWRLSEDRFRDAVTGLANRVLFETRLGQALDKVAQGDVGVAVMFVDFDDFKAVNDELGHAAGDELLLAAGRRIERCLRGEDVLARFGGDEFAVLLTMSDVTVSTQVADRIIAALSRPFKIRDTEVTIGSSIGIATSDGAQTAAQLIRDADAAMYTVKREGKGHHRHFDPAMDGAFNDRLATRVALAVALQENQLAVHYQPIVCTSAGTAVAVEALARWEHPERGLVPPSEFLPQAGSTPLIVAIDRWVMTEACRQVHRWNLESLAGEPLRVTVNISAHHLLRDDFHTTIVTILADTKLSPELLVLEITETVLMVDLDRARAVLDRVRGLGCRVALDDFGTGHSSLRYLQQLPIDFLKIDRSFTSRLGCSTEDEAVAMAITKLGQDLNLGVVAEGVESGLQLSRIEAMGCHLVQGYLFSRPLDAATTELYLASQVPYPLVDRSPAHG